LIASFLSNISAKYYKNPSMPSRVIAENVGDVFFETQCRSEFIRLSIVKVIERNRHDLKLKMIDL